MTDMREILPYEVVIMLCPYIIYINNELELRTFNRVEETTCMCIYNSY